jgi:hypothetical protein
MAFAEGTSVPVGRTKDEIERLVTKYGATRFASGWKDDGVVGISFAAKGRLVRFTLQLPTSKNAPVTSRSFNSISTWIDRETRRRWRCLLLVIKGKLDAVESGISTFDEQFLAHVVGPGNMTFYEYVRYAEVNGQRLLAAPAKEEPA